jgi:hypothetical protein
MSDYTEAMHELNDAIYKAIRAADNEDGAPVIELKEIAADIDSIIDHGMTRRAFEDAKRLYEGAKLAGLTG